MTDLLHTENEYLAALGIEWSDMLQVGLTHIDTHHYRLLRDLDRVVTHEEAGAYEAMRAALETFSVEVREHFSLEERVLDLLSYPDSLDHVARHKALHREFLDHTAEALAALATLPPPAETYQPVSRHIALFLRDLISLDFEMRRCLINENKFDRAAEVV